jgi:hypothetical protein
MDQLPRDRFDEYRGSQREVRTGLSRFCEQLALLDGGTIALVATNAVSHSGCPGLGNLDTEVGN